MRSTVTALIAFVVAALSASSATGAVPQLTGDTCVAAGNGTSYALTLTLPSDAPAQYGFAFGAPGGTVTNVVIAGSEGTLSTRSLPANSSGSWITMTALMPGTVVADLTTSRAVTGAFTVTPASATAPTFFGPIGCEVAHAVLPSRSFSVDRNLHYVAASHDWRLGVTIASPGVVSAIEPEPTVGTGGSVQHTATALVQTRRLGLKSPGTVTLVLRLTSLGETKLAMSSVLKVKLEVTFSPKDGKSASKVVNLTLKRP
jgi:hypothetical protein